MVRFYLPFKAGGLVLTAKSRPLHLANPEASHVSDVFFSLVLAFGYLLRHIQTFTLFWQFAEFWKKKETGL